MTDLTQFLSGTPGYFRTGKTASFPFCSPSVWFALLRPEGAGIATYGFTSAKSQRERLHAALVACRDSKGAMLLGVWHGAHKTHLFVLDRETAITLLMKSA